MIKKYSLLALSLSTHCAVADTFQFGLSPALINIHIPNIEGDSLSQSSLQPLSAMLIYEGRRDTRWLNTLSYYDFHINATLSNTGLSVESIALATHYQWRQRWTRHFKPWIGVGTGISYDTFSKRHLVDSDGFLAASFNDRDETNFSLNLNLAHEWSVSRNLTAGFNLVYQHTLNDGIEGFQANMTILY